MKKIFLLLAVVAGMAFTSCDGDPGPQGPQGEPGYTAEAQVYELENVNFVAPSFGIFFTFPRQILASDHVLVYRLSGIENGRDVWQLLPQDYFFPDGTRDFSYNYDFTQNDVNVYINGNDLGSLDNQFRINQILRFVSVPGYFAKSVDVKKYEDVTTALKLTDADFKKASAN